VTRGAPFELGTDEHGLGIALFHGFTSTPYEVSFLGAQLARAGYRVDAPLLPGHGTSIADLDRTTWQDWTAAAEATFEGLAAHCARVAVVGQALGGLLALELASRRPDVAAVASLAAPLWLEGMNGTVARFLTSPRGAWLAGRIPQLPKLGGSDVRDARARAENPCYRSIPVRALGELLAFMRVADEALPQITQPTLVLHATHDHTAPVACAHRIASRARARRLRILPRSYHLIAIDVERDLVADEVIQFLRREVSHSGEQPCAT
jgi:carboxylesterase